MSSNTTGPGNQPLLAADNTNPPPRDPGAPQPGTLRWLLEDPQSGYRARLNQILGDKRAPQFMASLVNLANSSKSYKDVEPKSIIAAGVIAATLDLPIDKNLGFAWVVPYKVHARNANERTISLAQFQIGYKGWIQLALRSGRYAGMNAVSVNAEALGGFDDIGDPIILWEMLDDAKPAIGYAFAWKLTTGFTKVVYWSRVKVENHAARYSQAYKAKKKDSPWYTDFDKMGLKTVISNSLRRYGIMSVEYQELQYAYDHDQSAAIDVDATPIYPDNDMAGDFDNEPEQREPIREPEARSLPAHQEQAGMTAESIKAAAHTPTRLERVLAGELKPRNATEREALELQQRGQQTYGTAPDHVATTVRDNSPWEREQQRAADREAAHHEEGWVAAATNHELEQQHPAAAAIPVGPAQPSSIKTIKVKMERATLSLGDLRKVAGFEQLASLDDLQASQVNVVLKWISNPTGRPPLQPGEQQ